MSFIEVGVVVEVVDGDGIKVEVNGVIIEVRYIGVNAPETYQPCGPEATEANRLLVTSQQVTLERDVENVDDYGRLLRYVFVGDVMVNAKLVEMGYAQAVSYPPNVKYQDVFQRLESGARDHGKGCWGPPAISKPVVIVTIFYDGAGSREPDEYVEITNVSAEPVDMTGWELYSVKGAQQDFQHFRFPKGFVMESGQACRIYTNQDHPEYCSLSFHSNGAIWNNQGDGAILLDSQGSEISRYCYKGAC